MEIGESRVGKEWTVLLCTVLSKFSTPILFSTLQTIGGYSPGFSINDDESQLLGYKGLTANIQVAATIKHHKQLVADRLSARSEGLR